MGLRAIELVAVKPYLTEADGGDVVLVFDSGDSLVIGERLLLDHDAAVSYIAGRVLGDLANDPGRADWRDFILELWAAGQAAAEAPTTAPPLAIQDAERLCTRNAPTIGTVCGGLHIRAGTLNEKARSCQVVMATAGRVRVADWERGVIEEILLVGGAECPAQLPLLDAHNRNSVGNLLGSVREIHTEGEQLIGRMYFAEGEMAANNAWNKVRGGHLTDASIGYSVLESETVPPGQSRNVAGREFIASPTTPLRVTTRFAIRECSLTPIGADPAAKLREDAGFHGLPPIRTGTMPDGFEQRDVLAAGLLHRCGLPIANPALAEKGLQYRHMALPDLCVLALRHEGREVPLDRCEAVRQATTTGTLAAVVAVIGQAQLLKAYEEEEDSTAGWVEEVEVDNFKPTNLLALDALDGPKALPRGGTAGQGTLNASALDYRVARYAKMYIVDEQDFLSDNLNAILDLPAQIGRTCKRIRPDLVYSLLLANGLMIDGVAMFHAGHANLGNTALSEAGLKAGVAAMGRQQEKGVRLNIRAKYLLVPSDLRITAAGILNGIEVQSAEGGKMENIALRSNARLSEGGVVDPTSGQVRVGSASKWFLASAPGRTIRIAYRRDTNRQPQLRSGPLDRGQYGVWFDTCFDIGAAVAGFRGLYQGNA